MCNSCGCDPCTCYCSSQPYCPPSSCPPNSGATWQWDASQVFYHKSNNEISELVNLEIENGASLELILETIDNYLAQLEFTDFALPTLTGLGYTITNLRQFAEAVDAEIATLQQAIEDIDPGEVLQVWLDNLSSDPGAAEDGQYWYNTVDNELRIKVNGNVKTITTT